MCTIDMARAEGSDTTGLAYEISKSRSRISTWFLEFKISDFTDFYDDFWFLIKISVDFEHIVVTACWAQALIKGCGRLIAAGHAYI